MTTSYVRPRAGLADIGPQLSVAGSPPNRSPPQVRGPATVRPLPASRSAIVMLPVAPPGAVSEP